MPLIIDDVGADGVADKAECEGRRAGEVIILVANVQSANTQRHVSEQIEG